VSFLKIFGTLRNRESLLVELANSQHYESRELMADILVSLYNISLHNDMSEKVFRILNRILREPNDDAKRVALKAAYAIGPGAKDIFVQGASDKSEATRKVVADYLYLVLKENPDYGNLIWDELMSKISIRAVRRSRSILQTLIEMSFKTFINQPNSDEAVRRVSETWHALSVEKLPVGSVASGSVIGQIGQQLLVPVVSSVTKTRILGTLFFTEYSSPEDFFRSAEDKKRAEKVLTHFLGDEGSVEDIVPLIIEMLESPTLFNHGLAVVVLGSECIKAPQRTIPIIREVFERLSGGGRLWILLQFSYFSLLEVPDGYLEVLEEFTERFVRENRDTFVADPWDMYKTAYVPLLALGLAYCKRGDNDFPILTKMIQEAVETDDFELVERCISGLAPIGFYFPKKTLRALENMADLWDQPRYLPALVRALATIRTLYVDEVDAFLVRTHASESLAKEIRVRMDADLVNRYVDLIGLFSTGVYSIVKRPFFGSWLISNVYFHAPQCNSLDEMAKLVTRDFLQLLEENDYYFHRAFR